MLQLPALRAFLSDESGAITVDWVVLTAAVMGLTLAMFGVFREALGPNSENLGTELQQYTLDTTFD
ncbi:MAG: pilus assembly protein [Pseudomonadota bacterium]